MTVTIELQKLVDALKDGSASSEQRREAADLLAVQDSGLESAFDEIERLRKALASAEAQIEHLNLLRIGQ